MGFGGSGGPGGVRGPVAGLPYLATVIHFVLWILTLWAQSPFSRGSAVKVHINAERGTRTSTKII